MKTNQFQLRVFDPAKDINFPSHNLDAWVDEQEYRTIKEQVSGGDNAPFYVKVKSCDSLNAFTFYAVLQSMNTHQNTNNILYVSKHIEGNDWFVEDGIEVIVEPLDYDDLHVAEVVTIRLNEDDVELWSEDESRFAEGFVKVHHQIAYASQRLWIKPATKQPTLSEVIGIIPHPKKEWNAPYQISERTKIIFEGLPQVQQTVIDFSRIGGLNGVLKNLREIIQIPLQYPELLERFAIRPPKGLLLYGPPGNGKTLIAKAVSHNMGAKFMSIEGPELLSKYVGVAEHQLRQKFEDAETIGNTVIFIDEIDSIASNRDTSTAEHQVSIVATLLNLMDGIRSRSKVFVIGATNRLNAVDPALRRPGRFDLEFEVPIPNVEARYDILTKYINVSNRELFNDSIDCHFLKVLSELTNGYSGADIHSLYRESVMNAIRKALRVDSKTGKIFLEQDIEHVQVVKDDFLCSIKQITPTSLRGVEARHSIVDWENILNLDAQKKKLLRLHEFLSKQLESDVLHHRPDFLNVIFKGDSGTGRKTLIRSFASKFSYELLSVDLFDIFTHDKKEASNTIEGYFLKAKQVAPSILYIRHLQHIDDVKFYFYKMMNEVNKLSIRHKILLIAELNSQDAIPEYFIGYKAFNSMVDFPHDLTDSELKNVFNSYLNRGYKKSFEEFSALYRNKAIGQIIAELEEFLFMSSDELAHLTS